MPVTDWERIALSHGTPASNSSVFRVTRLSTSGAERPSASVWISAIGGENSGKTSTGISRSRVTPKTISIAARPTTRNRNCKLVPTIQRIMWRSPPWDRHYQETGFREQSAALHRRRRKSGAWMSGFGLQSAGAARQDLRGFGEMLFQNVVNELRGAPHVHLQEDPRPVRADGLDAQGQRFGDLADALAAAEQAQDLILTIRETNVGCLAGRIAVAQGRH